MKKGDSKEGMHECMNEGRKGLKGRKKEVKKGVKKGNRKEGRKEYKGRKKEVKKGDSKEEIHE